MIVGCSLLVWFGVVLFVLYFDWLFWLEIMLFVLSNCGVFVCLLVFVCFSFDVCLLMVFMLTGRLWLFSYVVVIVCLNCILVYLNVVLCLLLCLFVSGYVWWFVLIVDCVVTITIFGYLLLAVRVLTICDLL